jgi:GrpB-like predicted nucleotidyltransferase (UPF0157 family)
VVLFGFDGGVALPIAGSHPPGMVAVTPPPRGLRITLPGSDRSPRVPGPDYDIDRHEVTNAEYKAFVDAGGYETGVLDAPLGYAHQSSPDADRYPFFHRPASWPHTHHVHLCPPESAVGRATLALRDYLREHPEARDAYAEEKRRLASIHGGATAQRREAYAEGKAPFLELLIERALRLGYPRD